MNSRYSTYHILSVIVCIIEVFPNRLRRTFHFRSGRIARSTCRRLAGFAYLCDDAGRTSGFEQANVQALPECRRGRRANGGGRKVRLLSRKGPRSAESTIFPPPSTTRFCIYFHTFVRSIYLEARLLVLSAQKYSERVCV